MAKYETVIHIINEGYDRYDAGERAGEILDGSKLTEDVMLYCEPTSIYLDDVNPRAGMSVMRYLVES